MSHLRVHIALIALIGCMADVNAADLSYESQFCSNISEYVRADDVCGENGDEDCCPPNISNVTPGPNLDSTSTDALCTTTKGKDVGGNTTMYVCAWETSGSAPTEAQVIAGTGPCVDALSKAVSASGEIHFEVGAPAKLTGLSSSTEHKISCVHPWESRATNELLASAPFTTLAGGGGGGDDLTGEGFFVDPDNGSDSDSGTHTAPWETVNKVNNSITAAGTKVYFLTDTSATGDLVVDWGGASDDIATLETYCIDTSDSNKPKAWTSGGTGCGAKAKITRATGNNPAIIVNSNFVTIKSIEAVEVTVNADGAGSGKDLVRVTGDNVTLDGIVAEGWGSKAAAVTKFGENRVTRGVVFRGADKGQLINSSVRYASFQNVGIFDGSTNIYIEGNDLRSGLGDSIRAHGSGAAERVWIDNNQLGDMNASDGYQSNGDFAGNATMDYVIISNNTIIGSVEENGIDTKGANHLISYGNTIAGFPSDNGGPADGGEEDCVSAGGIHKGGGDASSTPIIHRENTVYDNCSGMTLNPGWKAYHMTIVGNNRDHDGTNSSETLGGRPYLVGARVVGYFLNTQDDNYVGLRNSIIVGSNIADVEIAESDRPEWRLDLDYNLYYTPGQTNNLRLATDTDSAQPTYYNTMSAWRTALGNIGQQRGTDQNSVTCDPTFVDGTFDPLRTNTSYDWTPDTGSCALDAGGPLTNADGSGSSSTTLVVDDPYYFFDGWGFDDQSFTPFDSVSPDTIKIGTGTAVAIDSINYSTNTITLAAARSWSDNDPVYYGSSATPDIGAVQVE